MVVGIGQEENTDGLGAGLFWQFCRRSAISANLLHRSHLTVESVDGGLPARFRAVSWNLRAVSNVGDRYRYSCCLDLPLPCFPRRKSMSKVISQCTHNFALAQ